VRRFDEENNEEAGEHWTPRDACGTGGMLPVAEETLRQLVAEHGKEVATHVYGQEINAETYAIFKADLLLKGEGEAADNIVGDPEYSLVTRSSDILTDGRKEVEHDE